LAFSSKFSDEQMPALGVLSGGAHGPLVSQGTTGDHGTLAAGSAGEGLGALN
jgi:hypothetical protein